MSASETAIQAGFGAYFMTAHDLVHDLGRVYREGRLDRRMRVYLAPKVLAADVDGGGVMQPVENGGRTGASCTPALLASASPGRLLW